MRVIKLQYFAISVFLIFIIFLVENCDFIPQTLILFEMLHIKNKNLKMYIYKWL